MEAGDNDRILTHFFSPASSLEFFTSSFVLAVFFHTFTRKKWDNNAQSLETFTVFNMVRLYKTKVESDLLCYTSDLFGAAVPLNMVENVNENNVDAEQYLYSKKLSETPKISRFT